MRIIKTKKGVDIPIEGKVISKDIRDLSSSGYAFLSEDFPYLRASILVKEGDKISPGTPIISDKAIPRLNYISQVSGTVDKIMRGEQRAFIGLSIKVDSSAPWTLTSSGIDLNSLDRSKLEDLLLRSGLWSSFISRPFGCAANPDLPPSAIFITAADSRPLAPNVWSIIESSKNDFITGVKAISLLTNGTTYLCKSEDVNISGDDINSKDNVEIVTFTGPHPSGLPGTHIHFLHPVSRKKHVWQVDYQDVISIGKLLNTGIVDTRRVVALCGVGFKNPELVRVIPGSDLWADLKQKIKEDSRIISGSVFYGKIINEETPWISRFVNQVTSIPYGKPDKFMAWLFSPSQYFSIIRRVTPIKHLISGKQYLFDTAYHGPKKPMVPIGVYEDIMPLDVLMTPFLRYLASQDCEMSEKLGALELLEEDLSLSTYISPEKVDYNKLLRSVLDTIHKEI